MFILIKILFLIEGIISKKFKEILGCKGIKLMANFKYSTLSKFRKSIQIIC